jgi:hypothetical protein
MLLISNQIYAGERIEVFKVSNEPIEFTWYLIKDNTLFIDLAYTQEARGKIFEFENEKFHEIPMMREDVFKFAKKYEVDRIDDPDIKRKDIENNKYLILKRKGDSYTDYFMTIEENGKEKDISKNRYVLFAFGSYAYIDKEFQKIYFLGEDLKKKVRGLYIYDIINDKFDEMYVIKSNDEKSIIYSNPIRVPNTPYLMFLGVKDEQNWGLYIEEIPEWKEEMEAKNKELSSSEKEGEKQDPSSEVKEKKYVIDGPANLREKAKGKKVVGELADKEEVKILNKKGDWYEVQSEKIKGWTFKDNVKEAE